MAAGLYLSILSAQIFSMRTSVSRSFRIHVQVSKKRYIYTIDDDCFVAKTPGGDSINALEQHIRNLLTPSTPRFFNTLYDPFADGADFVRGYPFSWREGAPTAVSHGECLPFCSALCRTGHAHRAADLQGDLHVHHVQKQDIPASGADPAMLSVLGESSILSPSP